MNSVNVTEKAFEEKTKTLYVVTDERKEDDEERDKNYIDSEICADEDLMVENVKTWESLNSESRDEATEVDLEESRVYAVYVTLEGDEEMKGFDCGENEGGKGTNEMIITGRRPIVVKTVPRKHSKLGRNYLRGNCIVKRADKPRLNVAAKTSRACRTAEGVKMLKLCRSVKPADLDVKDLKSTRVSTVYYWTQEVT